ncbi:MAG: MFS transporter [Dehalococcoidia bacterium]|nr:MFS transporter [Dehalococcoidia bacterium]MSQ35034.1 MFS transporter [Dehalococcoidia bacterium]
MATPGTRRPRGKVFYGWWIVAAGGSVQWYVAAVFWRGFPAFFDSMVGTFGWSHAATAGPASIQRIQGGMISPFVGTVLDKFGPRKAMTFGVAVTGLGFMFMSQVNSLWQFYLSVALLTLGMSFGTFIVLVATVNNWFIRKRGQALSIMMAASALGGFTFPLLVFSIDHFGWRSVLFAVGVGCWIIGFPAAYMMKRSPEEYGLLPDGGPPPAVSADGKTQQAGIPRETNIRVKEAIKLRFFWQLALATSIGQMVSATNLVHLTALKEFGVSAGLAAAAVGSIAFGDLAGRLLSGVLGDRFDKRKLLAMAFAVEMIGTVGLTLVNYEVGPFKFSPAWTLPVFIVGFGLGFGATVPLRLAMMGDYFGRKSYGSIVGLMSSVSAGFGAAGPVFAGLMFDLTGDYRPAFAIMAALLVLAVPMSLALESQHRVAALARLKFKASRLARTRK